MVLVNVLIAIGIIATGGPEDLLRSVEIGGSVEGVSVAPPLYLVFPFVGIQSALYLRVSVHYSLRD